MQRRQKEYTSFKYYVVSTYYYAVITMVVGQSFVTAAPRRLAYYIPNTHSHYKPLHSIIDALLSYKFAL
jgi:hypothetical protein